ncbi:protein of unknown function [Pararobbsia alpina]
MARGQAIGWVYLQGVFYLKKYIASFACHSRMKGIRFASSLHNAGFAEQDAKLGSAAGSVIWQGFQADNAVNEVKRKQKTC